MDTTREYRFGLILATVGFIAAFTFFIHQSLKSPVADALSQSQLAAVDQTDNALVGWWKFDESSGSTAADSSNGGHSGTVSGTASWTTSAAVGTHALTFDGSSNVVETTAPSSLSGTSVFSVTFWAKPAALTAGTAIAIRNGTTDDNSFTIEPTNAQGGYGPSVSWPANSQLIKGSSSSLADGNWHFYAFVSRSATDHELFVDGVSVGTNSASKALPSGLTNITIGAKYSVFGGAGFFNGGLDDVRVFSRNLSSGEISTLYGLGSGGGGSTGGTGGSSGDVTAPSTPTGLTATVVSSSQINLSWTASTDNTGVTGYKIYRNGVQITTSNTTSYSNTGLNPSTSYSYTVAAYDAANNTSGQSSSASATTQAGSSGGGSASGGPGAGAHTIYVDQTLSNDCAGTYSIAGRNCSGSDGYAYNTAQEAADNSSPGNTVAFRGGTYNSVCVINQCSAIIVNNSGTSGNLITYESYGNENVVFRGIGFQDQDLDHDVNHYADGPLRPEYREQLVYVHGNYLDLKNFEITNSEGTGLWVDGSNDVVENIYAHDNWADNIDLGFNMSGALVQNDTIQNVESAYSHHGAGIGYGTLRQAGVQPIKNITIQDSLTYGNGFYLLNGVVTRVLPTGSDTEGGGNSWGIVADDSCSNYILSGYDSGCPNILIKGVVSWTNVDSSFVPEGDTLLLDNIGFDNGFEGDGLKVFDYVPNLLIVGNIIYHNRDRGVEIRSAGGGLFANNIAVDNGGFGIWGGDQALYNNIAWENDPTFSSNPVSNNSFCLNGEDCTNNLVGIDPMFYNEKPFQDSSGNIVVNIPTGKTIAQKVQWMKDQFYNSFSVKPGSPAIDIGKIYSYTDPVSGTPHTSSYYGAAPDAGAYDYQVGQIITPPAPPVQDNTAPTVLNLNATSITDTTATITWDTSEAATAEVDYSTDTSYSQHTTEITTRSNSHSQALSGLTASTLYYYRVISIDASNNPGQLTGTFTTTAAGAPPVNNTPAPTPTGGVTYTSGGGGGGGGGGGIPASTISNIKVSGSTASGVTVTWNTSNPASSQINYGLTSTYGSQTAFDPILVTSHSQKITGLLPNTLYHMQVRSKDAYGSLQTSADITFTTSSSGVVSTIVQNTPTVPISNIHVSGTPITSWLTIGATDAGVKSLQQLLNAAGFTVASSGTGSKGNESIYFGPATLAALEKFQCAKIQVCSGSSDTTGYGATGPRTRAALNALIGSSVSVPVTSVSTQTIPTSIPTVLPTGSITLWLYAGLTNSQVKTLQQLLNAKGYQVALSGSGSPGSETTYFGPATANALKKFQCAKLSVCSGSVDTTGYGATGPRTRAALNSK